MVYKETVLQCVQVCLEIKCFVLLLCSGLYIRRRTVFLSVPQPWIWRRPMSQRLFGGRFLCKRDEDLLLQRCVLVTPKIMWIQAAAWNWYLTAFDLWFTVLSIIVNEDSIRLQTLLLRNTRLFQLFSLTFVLVLCS